MPKDARSSRSTSSNGRGAKARAADTGAFEDATFELLRPIARGVAQTFGKDCEVVLHDYRDPEHSVVAVEGDVTHRHVAGAMSEIGLSLLAQGDRATDLVNYVTRAADGRVLKSTTILLRNPAGHVFGALCINFDITDLRMLTGVLAELTNSAPLASSNVSFSDDIEQVIRAVVDDEEARLGRSIDRLSKQERILIVRGLAGRGVFALQRSVPLVAECLGVSRATLYSYLEAVRAGEGQSEGTADLDGAAPAAEQSASLVGE